jgi:DNA-binding SARP family transcriptional activator
MDIGSQAQGRTRLTLLRGFNLVVAGHTVTLAPSSERLLAFMGIHDRPLLRRYVSGSLWPDVAAQRANANLRSALWRVPMVSQQPLVAATTTHLRLCPEVEVDFQIAAQRASRALRPGKGIGSEVDVELLCDDLLPDWYEDWIVFERERHRQLRLHALDVTCSELIELGRYGEALEIALKEVAAEPLRETAFRLLVRIHLAEGNVAEALRQYRRFAHMLDYELGVKPSASMRHLVEGYSVPLEP